MKRKFILITIEKVDVSENGFYYPEIIKKVEMPIKKTPLEALKEANKRNKTM